MNSSDFFKKKLSIIDNAELDLKSKATIDERWIYRRINEEVIPELDRENGVIVNNAANISLLTTKLNSIFRRFNREQNAGIVTKILEDFRDISEVNNSYFSIVSEKNAKDFSKVSSKVEKLMQRSLGLKADGTVKPNSFLSAATSNDAINQEIREIAIRNIQGGNTIKDFTAELSNAIKTDKNGLGVLNKHYRQTVNDRYAQYDRAESKTYADALKLQAFIYAGGKVSDTRKFCCQRNRLVFTRDEAKGWSKLKFQGKNKGYVPLVDLGGYNCRHSTQWISNREALRRRKDLMLDDKGKLVVDKSKSKRKLNGGCK